MKIKFFLSPDETQGGADMDVDALLNEIENPVDPNTPDPAAETATQTVQEYEIQHNGKVIKAPIDKIQQWASQGYNYSQQMAAFNKSKMDWENERKTYDPYKEVDTYARQNPQWWEGVRAQFQKVQQGQQAQAQPQNDGTDPLAPLIDPIKNDLNEIKQWKNELEQSRMAFERQQEDHKLDQEISTLHKEYSDIPFDRVDEEGRTLENRILEHAQKIGTKSYKAAFHDYMAPQLQKRAEERGREAAVKARQEQARRGLLGRTQAPTKGGPQPVQNYRNKTYSEIEKEALLELGIS